MWLAACCSGTWIENAVYFFSRVCLTNPVITDDKQCPKGPVHVSMPYLQLMGLPEVVSPSTDRLYIEIFPPPPRPFSVIIAKLLLHNKKVTNPDPLEEESFGVLFSNFSGQTFLVTLNIAESKTINLSVCDSFWWLHKSNKCMCSVLITKRHPLQVFGLLSCFHESSLQRYSRMVCQLCNALWQGPSLLIKHRVLCRVTGCV